MSFTSNAKDFQVLHSDICSSPVKLVTRLEKHCPRFSTSRFSGYLERILARTQTRWPRYLGQSILVTCVRVGISTQAIRLASKIIHSGLSFQA